VTQAISLTLSYPVINQEPWRISLYARQNSQLTVRDNENDIKHNDEDL
jgi:hypothetical protein